ncbi:MAG: desulfoferrodoxin family protein [Christensenellales bacterium]|nr:desulfoferrodoxin family protein [Clostridia bacterium]MDY4082691.1 desulfoferrodoxin family protein [Eubacteriales bacterium]
MKKFFICKKCGNFVGMINNSGVVMQCCGEPMTQLVASKEESGAEKHLPDVEIDGDIVRVNVGRVPHPMTPEHYIQWVCLETTKGAQRKKCGGYPQVTFSLVDEKPIAVYAYCNLHGLWMTKLPMV